MASSGNEAAVAGKVADMVADERARLGNPNVPERPKTFDELKESEQIQILRRELRIIRELLNSQQGVLDRLVRHSHSPDGAPSIPAFASFGSGTAGCGARRDELA